MIGYLCAYLRYYHPYEFITSYLNNAANDEDIKNGTDLATAYGIRISPPRYGVSRENYYFDTERKVIAKGVSSIRYLSAKVAQVLMKISSEQKPSTFIDFLCASKGLVDARQLDSLIKIDFFENYGNSRELFAIKRAFDFFKSGEAKSIKKTLISDEKVENIVKMHANGLKKDGSEAASYSFASADDLRACMLECQQLVLDQHLPDLDLKVKIANCLDVLGYVDIATGKEEDRRRLLITGSTPLVDKSSGATWAYRIDTRSLGSGKTSRISVKADVFNKYPFAVGDIVYADDVWKNNKGFWYLSRYRVE